MLKKGLRLLCAVLACVMSVVSVNTAFAVSEVPKKAYEEMQALGIVKGDENGELNLEKEVTRAEFATMMVRLLNIGDLIYTATEFSDVNENDWFYGDVMRLVMSGIISGYNDGTFRPDDYISPQEAAKIIVAALGYNYSAELYGGYPEGYMTMAGKLGVLKDANINRGYLLRSDIIMMLYNSMDAPIMEKTFEGGTAVYNITNETIRDYHIYHDRDGVSVKNKGYVTATAQTWLVMPYPLLKDNEVVIDGTIMNVGNTNAKDYLGMEVMYYVTGESESGPYTLTGIYPTDKNETYEFDEYTYIGKSGDTIHGYVNGKEKKIKLDEFCSLIRNMRPVTTPSANDYIFERGSVKVVDNDEDGKAEYVFIDEFESVIASRTSEDKIWLDTSTLYNDKAFFDLSRESEASYFIVDENNTDISVGEISNGDILSIISDGNTVYKIIRGKGEISGKVTNFVSSSDYEDSYIEVDGEKYRLERGYTVDVNVGDDISCKLNFRGEVADVKNVDNTNLYGYVLNAAVEDNGEDYVIRLVLPGLFNAEVKIDDEEEDNLVETQILKGRNSDVKTLRLNEKVRVGDRRLSAKDAVRSVSVGTIIKYTLNENEEINTIDFPEITGTDVMSSNKKRSYNGFEQIFGGINEGAFAVENNTSVLCIPDADGVTCSEDYLASVEILDGSTYAVNGYDIDEEDEVVKLIVIQVPLRFDSATGIDEHSEVILEKSVAGVNEFGEVINTLIYWQDGERKQMDVNEDCDVSDLKKGDVLLLATGITSEEIMKIEKVAELAELSPGIINLGNGIGELLGGTVSIGYPMEVEYGKIHDLENRRVDKLVLAMDENCIEQKIMNINVRNAPNVYTYRISSNEIEPCDTKMIEPCGTYTKDADLVLVYEKNLKTKLVVIVKE